MDTILQEISSLPLTQWLATLFSLLYIFFAVRNQAICFVFGIIGCALWAYEDFVHLNLKFDGLLQIFYIAMSFWGLYQWQYGGDEKKNLPVRRWKWVRHVPLVLFGLAISWLAGWIGQTLWATSLPLLDAITTAFSVVATYLLVHRVIENWLYWIVFNIMYIYIYIHQGAYLFALIMAVYIGMAVVGYVRWSREWKAR